MRHAAARQGTGVVYMHEGASRARRRAATPAPSAPTTSPHPFAGLTASCAAIVELLEAAGVAFALYDASGRRVRSTAAYEEAAADRSLDAVLEAARRTAVTNARLAAGRAAGRAAEGAEGDAIGPRERPTHHVPGAGEGGTRRVVVSTIPNGRLGAVGAVVVERGPDGGGPSDAALRGRYGLSARELQVARLVADGRTTPQVAQALGISPHTARHHTERLFGKLGVRSRHAVRAIVRGEPGVEAALDG